MEKCGKVKGYFGMIFTAGGVSLNRRQDSEEPSRLNDQDENCHLLFVDDNQELACTLPKTLQFLGYRVTCQTSSLMALEIFQSQPQDFSMVITDLDMQQMNGLELAQKIRLIRPDIPIILHSGSPDVSLEIRAQQAGINKFIMKPIRARELDFHIRQTLASMSNSEREID